MVEKMTIKKIKEKAHERGLKVGQDTAREIKKYLKERKHQIRVQDDEKALKMIFEFTKNARRKTVKKRDLEQFENFECYLNLGA